MNLLFALVADFPAGAKCWLCWLLHWMMTGGWCARQQWWHGLHGQGQFLWGTAADGDTGATLNVAVQRILLFE
jgi:hypothetical protein